MLKPELQDADVYADSVEVIVETHRRVAQSYIDDDTIAMAVPPLRALLEYMATGRSSEGWTLHSPELRELFTRENVLASDWYATRLAAKQRADICHYEAAAGRLELFQSEDANADPVERLHVQQRLVEAYAELGRVKQDAYRASLVGTVGLQPL